MPQTDIVKPDNRASTKALGAKIPCSTTFKCQLNDEDIHISEEEEEEEEEEEQPSSRLEDQLTDYKLKKLQEIFALADERSGGGLDMAEFRIAMHKALGGHLTANEMNKLFMKVDTNCDGTVDWDEYLSYMLLEYREKDAMNFLKQKRPFPPFPYVVPNMCQYQRHHDNTSKLIHMPSILKYLTGLYRVSTDKSLGRIVTVSIAGVINMWSHDLHHLRSHTVHHMNQSLQHSKVWVTDAVFMANLNMMAVSLTAGYIAFYLLAASHLSPVMSITDLDICVTAMDYYCSDVDPSRAILLWGDMRGTVCGLRIEGCPNICFFSTSSSKSFLSSIPFKELLANTGKFCGVKGYKLANIHDDFVLKVRYLPTYDYFLSCCRSSNVSMYMGDLEGRRKSIFNVPKGVCDFDYSKKNNTIVTGGRDCIVRAWNPYVATKPVMLLQGHKSPVIFVVINEVREQVITISECKEILIYDLNTQTCLQCIFKKCVPMGPRPLATMCFNPHRQSLYLASNNLCMFENMEPDMYDCPVSHNDKVNVVLYNSLFNQVVSGGSDSQVIVWGTHTGEKIIQFYTYRKRSLVGDVTYVEITKMRFDPTLRRLITASREGIVRIWNFNNGGLLRELQSFDSYEVTGIVCPPQRILTAGWSQVLRVYIDSRDNPDDTVIQWSRQHTDDISALAYCPPSMVVTGSHDGYILGWSLETGQVTVRLNANIAQKPITCQSASRRELQKEQGMQILRGSCTRKSPLLRTVPKARKAYCRKQRQREDGDETSDDDDDDSCDEELHRMKNWLTYNTRRPSICANIPNCQRKPSVLLPLNATGDTPLTFCDANTLQIPKEAPSQGENDGAKGVSDKDNSNHNSNNNNIIKEASDNNNLVANTGNKKHGIKASDNHVDASDKNSCCTSGTTYHGNVNNFAKQNMDKDPTLSTKSEFHNILRNKYWPSKKSTNERCHDSSVNDKNVGKQGDKRLFTARHDEQQMTIEQNAMEQEKMEQEKMEQEKMEQEKMEQEKMEHEKMEQEKKLEQKKMEQKKYDTYLLQNEATVEKLLFLESRVPDALTATIVVVNSCGWIRLWSIDHDGGLLGQFNAGQKQDDVVGAITTDKNNKLLVTGDCNGYIKVWDISEYCINPMKTPPVTAERVLAANEERGRYVFLAQSITAREKASSQKKFRPPHSCTNPAQTWISPFLLNCFQGHTMSVSDIAYIDGERKFATCSHDHSVRLWTIYGEYIGTYDNDAPWRKHIFLHKETCKVRTASKKHKHTIKPKLPQDVMRVATASTLRVLNGGKLQHWNLAKNTIMVWIPRLQQAQSRTKVQQDKLKQDHAMEATKRASNVFRSLGMSRRNSADAPAAPTIHRPLLPEVRTSAPDLLKVPPGGVPILSFTSASPTDSPMVLPRAVSFTLGPEAAQQQPGGLAHSPSVTPNTSSTRANEVAGSPKPSRSLLAPSLALMSDVCCLEPPIYRQPIPSGSFLAAAKSTIDSERGYEIQEFNMKSKLLGKYYKPHGKHQQMPPSPEVRSFTNTVDVYSSLACHEFDEVSEKDVAIVKEIYDRNCAAKNIRRAFDQAYMRHLALKSTNPKKEKKKGGLRHPSSVRKSTRVTIQNTLLPPIGK